MASRARGAISHDDAAFSATMDLSVHIDFLSSARIPWNGAGASGAATGALLAPGTGVGADSRSPCGLLEVHVRAIFGSPRRGAGRKR
eukprot:9492509-Pyramimonas_sp.AAC.1